MELLPKTRSRPLRQPGLIHEQIRLPMFIYGSDKVADEHDMIRPNGLSLQRHVRFGGCPISFPVVAVDASAYKILPAVETAASARNNVIHSQRDFRLAAVLTTMAIPTENILAGKNDFLIRNTDVDREANDARERHRHRN